MRTLFTSLIVALTLNPIAAQWTNYAFAGLDVLQDVYFLDANNGFVCGWQGTSPVYTRIFKTTNGGSTWTQVFEVVDDPFTTGTSHSLHAFEFTSSSTGFCVGGRNGLYPFICKTTNGGATWDTLSLTIPQYVVNINFPTSTTGYMCGEPPVASTSFYKTIDGGVNWTDMSASMAPQVNYCPIKDIEFLSATDGYAVTLATSSTQAGIYKTSDGGVTWIQQYTIGNNEGFTSVQFINANDGFVSGLVGKVYKTNNGGATWTPIPITSISNDVQDVHFVNAQIGYAASTTGFNAGIYKTTNGGASWILDNSGNFTVMYGYYNFSFVGSTAYACGTGGYSKTTTAPVGISEVQNSVSIDVFPNPASSFIKINFDSDRGDCPITISITDMTGALVRRERYMFTTNIEISTAELADGEYLVTVESEHVRSVSRFTVLR